jgi:hypothetical protein
LSFSTIWNLIPNNEILSTTGRACQSFFVKVETRQEKIREGG